MMQYIGRPVLCEPFRPRAATFTSLTAQTRTKIPTALRDASSQPLLFPPTVLKQDVTQEERSLTKGQAPTSNSHDSLPTHKHLTTQPYNTAKPDPLSTQSSNQDAGSKTHTKTTQKTDTKSRHVTESLCDGEACGDIEKTNVTESANVTRAQQDTPEERPARDPQSPTFFLHCSSHSLNTEATMISPSVLVTDSDVLSKTSQYEKSDCEDNCSEACESRCHEIKCGSQEKYTGDKAGGEHESNTVLSHSHVLLNVQGDSKKTGRGDRPLESTPPATSKSKDQSKEEDTLLIPKYIAEKNEGKTVEEKCTLHKDSREDTAGNGSHFSLVQNTQAVRSRIPCSTKLLPNGSSCGITCQHKNSAEDTANEQVAHLPANTETLHNQFYTSTCDWKIGSNQSQNKSSCDSTTPLLKNIDPHLQQGLHKPTVEEVASTNPEEENSPTRSVLPQQLNKYLPKILQRQKGGRRGKKWWSDVMRNKSYHGLSLEIKPSDHVQRAQSISGAIET